MSCNERLLHSVPSVWLQVSLKGGFKSTQREHMKVARRSNLLDKMPNRSSVQANNTTSSATAPAAAAVAAPALPPVSLGILGYGPFLCLFVAGR